MPATLGVMNTMHRAETCHECSLHLFPFSAAFSLFGVGASSFQSTSSPVLCFFYLYNVFSYNITPPLLRSSYLSVSTHFHISAMFSSLPLPHYFSLHGILFLLASFECNLRFQGTSGWCASRSTRTPSSRSSPHRIRTRRSPTE